MIYGSNRVADLVEMFINVPPLRILIAIVTYIIVVIFVLTIGHIASINLFTNLISSVAIGLIVGSTSSFIVARMFEKRQLNIELVDLFRGLLFNKICKEQINLARNAHKYEQEIGTKSPLILSASDIHQDVDNYINKKELNITLPIYYHGSKFEEEFSTRSTKYNRLFSLTKFEEIRVAFLQLLFQAFSPDWCRDPFVAMLYRYYVIVPFFKAIENNLQIVDEKFVNSLIETAKKEKVKYEDTVDMQEQDYKKDCKNWEERGLAVEAYKVNNQRLYKRKIHSKQIFDFDYWYFDDKKQVICHKEIFNPFIIEFQWLLSQWMMYNISDFWYCFNTDGRVIVYFHTIKDAKAFQHAYNKEVEKRTT